MNMPVGSGNDQPQSIHEQVDHIIAGLAFDEVHQQASLANMSSKQIMKHLRTLLVNVQGQGWHGCTIEEHTLPGGQISYTAARLCMRCRTIHVFIVTLDEFGNFEFAAPAEGE